MGEMPSTLRKPPWFPKQMNFFDLIEKKFFTKQHDIQEWLRYTAGYLMEQILKLIVV